MSSSSLEAAAASDFRFFYPCVLTVFMILSRVAISMNSSTIKNTAMAVLSTMVRNIYSPKGRLLMDTMPLTSSGSLTRNWEIRVTMTVCFLNFFFWKITKNFLSPMK